MTDSFREEIENIVHEDHFAPLTPVCDTCSDKTLKIISVFKKRIEELRHETEMRIFDLEDLGEDIEVKALLYKYEIIREIEKQVLKK